MTERNNNVQSIDRAFCIITELSRNKSGISLTQLSKNVNLHKATVSRILKTLHQSRIVRQDPATSSYSLGIGFLELALSYLGNIDIKNAAIPHMKSLNAQTNETVNLAIMDVDEIIYIDRIESRQDLRHSITVGKRAPIYCTSLGKAMLAFVDPILAHNVLNKKPLIKLTSFTKSDPDAIEQELEVIRQKRIALDDREHQEHIRCIGSPLFDSLGKVVGAISLSGPAIRVTPEKAEIYSDLLLKTATTISNELGWIEK